MFIDTPNKPLGISGLPQCTQSELKTRLLFSTDAYHLKLMPQWQGHQVFYYMLTYKQKPDYMVIITKDGRLKVFQNAQQALDWGGRLGLRSAELLMDYQNCKNK